MLTPHMIPNEMHPPGRPRSPLTAAVVMMGLLLLLLATALFYVVYRGPQQAPANTTILAPTPPPVIPRADLPSDEQTNISLFSGASPSVVHVTSVKLQRSRFRMNVQEIPQGTGSGFIWDKEGHIVTNFHVIKNGSSATVTLYDNTQWKAKIVGFTPDKDLAILKIDAPAERLAPLAIGTSNNLQVGQKVFAIGNPFGLDQTLTTGVISGLGREIQSVTRRPIRGVIQTDAAINPGNSGGPLLDSAGQMIGVNTAIYSTSGSYAGIGFAVPVDTIRRIVPQLISHGTIVRPGLGVTIGTDNFARRARIDGVIVMSVPPESAAGKAGLVGAIQGNGSDLVGDVIIGIDGSPVHTSTDLYRGLDEHGVGEIVTLTVVNRKKQRDVEVQLQPLP